MQTPSQSFAPAPERAATPTRVGKLQVFLRGMKRLDFDLSLACARSCHGRLAGYWSWMVDLAGLTKRDNIASLVHGGIGPVEMERFKICDRGAASDGKRIRFSSAILPLWRGGAGAWTRSDSR